MMKYTVQEAVVKTNYTTWGFSMTGVAASLANLDWVAIIATSLGLISLVLNIILMVKKDRTQTEESKARMELLHQQTLEVMERNREKGILQN